MAGAERVNYIVYVQNSEGTLPVHYFSCKVDTQMGRAQWDEFYDILKKSLF